MHCPAIADIPSPPSGNTGWPWTVDVPPLPSTQPDGSAWPRISIVTPSYNQGQFIEETIRSVLLQGYPDLEYIVIDGGSSDASVEIIKKYGPWLSHWVSEPDDGQSHAINKGFSQTSGAILNWLNSDDFLVLGALREMGEAFGNADETVGAIAGRGHKIDDNYRQIYSPFPERIDQNTLLETTYGWNFMQPACFFRRSAWDVCGPIRNDLHYCMDLSLWLDIAAAYKFRTLQTDIAFCHVHPGAKTVADRKELIAEIAVLLASKPGGFSAARRVAMDLVRGNLASDEPTGRQLAQIFLRKLSRRLKNAFVR